MVQAMKRSKDKSTGLGGVLVISIAYIMGSLFDVFFGCLVIFGTVILVQILGGGLFSDTFLVVGPIIGLIIATFGIIGVYLGLVLYKHRKWSATEAVMSKITIISLSLIEIVIFLTFSILGGNLFINTSMAVIVAAMGLYLLSHN
jgi:hypothetical protein